MKKLTKKSLKSIKGGGKNIVIDDLIPLTLKRKDIVIDDIIVLS